MSKPYTRVPDKKCKRCGVIFSRKSATTFAVWKRRIFCSGACYLAAKASVWDGLPATKKCEACGCSYKRRRGEASWQFGERRFCSRKCIIRTRKPLKDLSRPYRQVKVNGRRTMEHRLIVEQDIGRELHSREYVHHRNEDPRDNRLENLQVVSPAEHSTIHATYPVAKKCVICDREFTPHKTKRKRQQQCGRPECKHALMSMRCHNRKLSNEQVAEIRQRRTSGEKLRILAERFGVTESTICEIALGKRRR